MHQRHRTAEVRIVVGERSAWGTGVGTTATRLITSYAFHSLGLEKLYAYTMDRNPRAMRSFVKAGYTVEARLQHEVFWDGKREDAWRVALCKEELPGARTE